ncbi:hypothetical protein [Nostoc sp.]|uniref:hypothetical protein n=1 Tax=Nostoc sp. TaxID=1180 RepID=UPI002FFCED3B
MNNNFAEINDSFQADPAWDYYEVCQGLIRVREQINKSIAFISAEEEANNDTDEKLKQMLEPALEQFESIIENDLTDCCDDDS